MGDIEGDFEEYVMSHIDITINGNETQIQISPTLIEREVITTRSFYSHTCQDFGAIYHWKSGT